jgi:glucose/arabinose dehydrogenase
MPRHTRILSISLATAVSTAVSTATADPEGGAIIELPPGFVHQPIASGVANPNSFAFLPDGRVLVTEQKQTAPNDGKGFVYLVVGSGVTPPVLVIEGVETNGPELGLQGIAVDPAWPTRPYVYVHFTADGPHHVVRRYTASGDLDAPSSMVMSLDEPYDVLIDLPGSHEFHNGGTLRFGPDGMLYISQGDDATDVCEDLQDPGIWKGVILRLDVSGLPAGPGGPPPKASLVPPDNPWSGPSDNARLTYAVGFRNPFRFSIDPVTQKLYIGDVGQDAWEELDESVGGDNFGWPQREGAHPYAPGTGCGSVGKYPIAEYAHTDMPNAIIAGPRYRDSAGAYTFGPDYYGDVFYIEFYEGWLRRVKLVDGLTWQLADPVPGQPTPTEWGTGFAFVSDLQTGPDGALYYVRRFADDFFGRIVRDPETVDVGEPAHEGPGGLTLVPRPLHRASTLGVTFELERAGAVEIELFDIAGRRVRTVHDDVHDAGRHTVAWRADVEPGVYFLRASMNGRVRTERLAILR